jgi:hypothetical protein
MSRIPLLFGRFLVKNGWASEANVQRAVQLQRELTPSMGLAAVLTGLLSIEALRQTLAHQRRTGQLFQEAVHTLGFLNDEQLAFLDAQCRATGLPLGEVMRCQGTLSAQDLQDALQAFATYHDTSSCSPGSNTYVLPL